MLFNLGTGGDGGGGGGCGGGVSGWSCILFICLVFGVPFLEGGLFIRVARGLRFL